MAETLNITDGTTTVPLNATGATGFIARRGGVGSAKIVPHQYDKALSFEDYLFVESYNTKLKGSSHDNAASQEQTLLRLLRKAYRYWHDPRQRTPVYLTRQTANEMNARYAVKPNP